MFTLEERICSQDSTNAFASALQRRVFTLCRIFAFTEQAASSGKKNCLHGCLFINQPTFHDS